MKVSYNLEGLDCANCAAKIENEVKKIPNVENATVNFMTTKLEIEAPKDDMDHIVSESKAIINRLEPDVRVTKVSSEKKDEVSDTRKQLYRILIGAAFFILAIVLKSYSSPLNTPIYLIAFLIIGGDVVWKALKNIVQGQVFDEHFLMSIATIGAFALGDFTEGVAVMLFYQIGELFQDYAVDESRKSITGLMDIRPDYANINQDGKVIRVSPEDVKIGQSIIVKPGERVPIDAEITNGSSLVDTSAITGESVPREVTVGSTILSGYINQNGTLTATTTKEFADSTASKILDLVENASSKKSKSENFITKFARVYTPIVVIAAALLAIVLPFVFDMTFQESIYRALTFLVISCPCALVISVPLSFFGGLGAASKIGVLVKGSNYMETLAQADTVVFDKTGTLTKGVFKVNEIHTDSISKDELLYYAAYAESYSSHPISKSLRDAYGKEVNQDVINDTEEISGHGVKAVIDGKTVLAGNEKLMKKFNIEVPQYEAVGTVVHVAVDGKYAGYIVISDEVKDDAAYAMKRLKEVGVKRTVMLTGDSKVVGESVAKSLGIDQVKAELLPEDKVKEVEQLITEETGNEKVAFVGDGINDAPVLARADVGIAMGGLGSDAAIEAADVVIMTDEPSRIASAIEIARRTLSIAKQNIVFAISVKVIFLILGALGYASMAWAVFADVGVAFLAILNAIRVLNVKKIEKKNFKEPTKEVKPQFS